MRTSLAALTALAALTSCEVRQEIGVSCAGFVLPEANCTASYGSCFLDEDCDVVDGRCNLATERCFRDSDRCVGTPCVFDDDCPAGERCNNEVRLCYDQTEDQVCMPCFLDSDCGATACDVQARRCR